MELAYEGNTSLACDTTVMRTCALRYSQVASDLNTLSTSLTKCLNELKDTGWTTPAGTAFCEMVDTDWSQCLGKYISMLKTLSDILYKSADMYDGLITEDIEVIKMGTPYINNSAGGGRF